jgi:hypothetical protein
MDTLLLLLLVTSLAVTSCAEIESKVEMKVDDNRELKDLLNAVKHYLDEKETKAATRLSASADERIIYDATHTEADVTAALAAGTGYWTEWINSDTPAGIGEFEDCGHARWKQNADSKCYLGCEQPIAVKYKHALPTVTGTWGDIEKCIGPLTGTSCGVTCVNTQASKFPKTDCAKDQCDANGIQGCGQCPDVTVQYFCLGTAPPVDQCCPYSNNCKKGKDLKTQLEQVENLDDRRDVIAEILENVKEAVNDIAD